MWRPIWDDPLKVISYSPGSRTMSRNIIEERGNSAFPSFAFPAGIILVSGSSTPGQLRW